MVFTCTLEGDASSKVATTEAGKVTWEAGDEILVHGEGSSNRAVVTLSAGDISADGKTATISVTGIEPYDRSDKGIASTIYAAYPASAVINANLYYYATFNSTNEMLMAGYNVGNELRFRNLCGAFCFTVSGDYDSYTFSGNNGETVGYGTYEVKLVYTGTAESADYNHDTKNPVTSISGPVVSDGSTLNFIYIPQGANFTEGFTIKLYKGENLVKVARTGKSENLTRNKLVRLGSLNGHLSDPGESDTHESDLPVASAVDLGADGTANCYVVYEPGVYKFKAVKGNSSTTIGQVASVEVLWETWCGADAVQAGSVVSAVDFQENYICFKIAEGYHYGNALIAAKSAGGSILWSWHIWAPESSIETNTYSLSSALVMDRNLGALKPAPESNYVDGSCFGLFYQWGRKDPFPGMASVSSKTVATVSGTATSILTEQITLDASIAQPTVYATIQNGNWCSAVNDDLWGKSSGNKTIYDPCPPGYKVPRRSDASPIFSDLTGVTGWSSGISEYRFLVGSPATSFPFAGYIDDYITAPGSYAYPGDRAAIWSADGSSASAHCQDIRKDKANGVFTSVDKSNPKARGASVRCISEEVAPFENEPGMPVQGSYTRTVMNTSVVHELSGICFSKDKDFIWGVGDGGELYKINFDMSVSLHWSHSADMEDITLDPSTGNLLIAIEGEQKIYRVNAPNYNTYSTIFYIQDAVDMNIGNSGLEGLAYYKDNTFYVGAQYGATLWKYNLNGTKIWKKTLGSIAPGILEVGGLCYDAERDELWVTDSEAFKLFVFDGEVSRLKAVYDVSAVGNPESVLVDHKNSCVYVGDDGDSSSKIYKYSFTNL